MWGGGGWGGGGGGEGNIQQKLKRKVWVIVLISFLWEKTPPYPHINSGNKINIKSPKKDALSFVDMADSTCILTQGILYVEIIHLRKAEPIQLYQILNKGKTLKNFKQVLFIIFLKFEVKFDTQC